MTTAVPRPAEPAAPVRYRQDIQGLRAVSVALVVLGAVGVPGLTGGYVGVDVFFVISGFVGTSALVAELRRTGSIAVLEFLARRVRRTVPLAATVIVVTVVASYGWLGYVRSFDIALDGQWAAAFGANLHFATSGNRQVSPLLNYWSLSVGAQFYLIWPLLLWLLYRIVGRQRSLLIGTAALLVVSFVWSIVETSHDAGWAYFSPLTRVFELLSGALVAVAAPRLAERPRWLPDVLGGTGLAVIAVCAVAVDRQSTFPGWIAALPVAGAVLVLMSGPASDGDDSGGLVARHLLGNPTMVLLGGLSYGLYLWHWPLLIIAEQHQATPLSASARVAVVCGAVALSVVCHLGFEDRLQRCRWLANRPLITIVLGATITAAVFAVMIAELWGHPH